MGTTDVSVYDEDTATVGDIAAARKCLLFYPEEYVKIILRTMQHNRVGCAGVIDDQGALIGLLTEREILRRLFALTSDPTLNPANIGKYIDDMRVMDVMISHPETLDSDTDIEDALQLMTDMGFRYMPVVSRFNRKLALGFVDEREVAIHVAHRLERLRREAAQKEMVFQQLWREPYGSGFNQEYS